MAERFKNFGSFHPMYFFHNFVYMFIQGFHLEFSLPMYLDKPHVDPFGTSLTFASPFVFFAFKARGRSILLWGAWISVSLCLLHMLFYFSNGWVQENGIRYALDFFPVLIVLVALGMKNVENQDVMEECDLLFGRTQFIGIFCDLLCMGSLCQCGAMGQKSINALRESLATIHRTGVLRPTP